MKYKRNLIWLILIIAMLMAVGCKKNEETKKEAEIEESQETKESKAVKESKSKKEKQEKNSKKPHILLNEMNEHAYDSYEGEYLYNLRSIKISLKEEEGFDSLRKAIEEYNEKMEEKFLRSLCFSNGDGFVNDGICRCYYSRKRQGDCF